MLHTTPKSFNLYTMISRTDAAPAPMYRGTAHRGSFLTTDLFVGDNRNVKEQHEGEAAPEDISKQYAGRRQPEQDEHRAGENNEQSRFLNDLDRGRDEPVDEPKPNPAHVGRCLQVVSDATGMSSARTGP